MDRPNGAPENEVSQVENLQQELRELRSLVERRLVPEHQLKSEEWVCLKRAAIELGWHPDTARDRALRFGIGVKPGGRWRIDLIRARAWLRGELYERLQTPDK
jgi:hypothetical protein